MKLIFTVLIALTLLSNLGCSSSDTYVKKSSPSHDTLLILEPSFDKIILSDMNEDELQSFNVNMSKYTKCFVDNMSDILLEDKIYNTVDKYKSSANNPLVLECHFTEFNAGNRALRFFVSFGAGKTEVEMECKLSDNTGILAKEEKSEDATAFYKLGGPESYFQDFIKELSEEFANFVIDYKNGDDDES